MLVSLVMSKTYGSAIAVVKNSSFSDEVKVISVGSLRRLFCLVRICAKDSAAITQKYGLKKCFWFGQNIRSIALVLAAGGVMLKLSIFAVVVVASAE